jgi:hypothetical protein
MEEEEHIFPIAILGISDVASQFGCDAYTNKCV